MRYLSTLSFVVAFCMLLTACSNSSTQKTLSHTQPIDIMSFNIRYANQDDGPNRWNNRKKRVFAFIKFYHPDFLGTQEVLYKQLKDLENGLTDYDHIGVGRKDGKKKGEFSALFYNAERFTLIENTAQTLWLSKTPKEPSKSWDAALPRIVTFGQFKDQQTGDTLWVFNTHFDHRGETARQKSAKLILETIEKVSGDAPVILMGDFNVSEDMPPYKILTSSTSPLKDSFYASAIPPIGPNFTFEGFTVNSDHKNKHRIDYIFVNDRLKVTRYATLATYRDGYHLSDHLPIMATVVVK